jgi:ribose transport system ATP-binding protein
MGRPKRTSSDVAGALIAATRARRRVRAVELACHEPFAMEGVSKRFGGVRALSNADIAVEAGRIHAVLGENGAGKSTLIKIMAGVVAPDEGR